MVGKPSVRSLIVLEKVNERFGDLHVLRDIDFSVQRGEVVVVLGPSGMCRTINRLETIDSGRILIDGVPLPEEGRELAQALPAASGTTSTPAATSSKVSSALLASAEMCTGDSAGLWSRASQ